MRGKRIKRKVLGREREDNSGKGNKTGAQKRPSEQERQLGRAVRFSFVVIGE